MFYSYHLFHHIVNSKFTSNTAAVNTLITLSSYHLCMTLLQSSLLCNIYQITWYITFPKPERIQRLSWQKLDYHIHQPTYLSTCVYFPLPQYLILPTYLCAYVSIPPLLSHLCTIYYLPTPPLCLSFSKTLAYLLKEKSK